MKRILIMIDSLTCGGAEKSLISLLPFLSEMPYDITLMLSRKGGLFEQYVPSNVRVIDFPNKPSLARRLIYSLSLRLPWNKNRHKAELYWKKIGKYFPKTEEKFDVAIAYQQGFPTFYVKEKVVAPKKLCWINVDLKSAGYSADFCKSFYDGYDKIATVSEVLRDKIVYPKYCSDKNKIFVCWDILNEQFIRDMSKKNPIKKENNTFHITTVGRLVYLKGYDLAIESAEILKEKGINFIWHFVGNGPLYQELQDKICQKGLDNNIILEGEKLNPYPYIAAADIYVQTSRHEGFGITIGEAKILGKPIVSTNFPVVNDQLINGSNGIIVDMTPEEISKGIMNVINNSALRTRLIEAVLSEHNTTSETESKKVISIIENLLCK